MEPITRLTGENFHKRGGKSILSTSLTGSSFYLHENKTDTYQTLIQMLRSDLIQIQDMINNNSSDIKMYKLLSKTPGLTKKLSQIEENKNITSTIDKMAEDSKNIDKISKIYGCKNQELISKLYLEVYYNELLLSKLCDYFILMKLKLYKDDTYQESLSRVIPIQSFMEKASNLVPTSGTLDERILQLSMDKEKLTKEIIELKKQNNNSNESENNKLLELKEKEIKKLKKENENLKKQLEEEKDLQTNASVNNSTIFETEVKFKDSKDFKKILENFEKETKKSREEFSNKINEEITEIKTKFDKLEQNYNVINEERMSLKKSLDKLRNVQYDPDSYEEVLRQQFENMKNAFLKKIEDLDEELNSVKQESRIKLYQMEEEMKESNYLKNIFLNQVITLQSKLEK
jgi:myosin heavy subunit